MKYHSQDKIKYKFEMAGFSIEENATVTKVENEKVYVTNDYNQSLIFDSNTKHCLTENPSFGAKRTLIG